jgi:hypothetical protein
VVVYHIDRLYRQPRELEDWIDLAGQGQVEIVSVHSGDIDLTNSDGRAMARVLVAMAAKERDDKSRRIKRAKAAGPRAGVPARSRRAFGWIDGMSSGSEEAAVIRRAVDDLLGGAAMADGAPLERGGGGPAADWPGWLDAIDRPPGDAQPAARRPGRLSSRGPRFARSSDVCPSGGGGTGQVAGHRAARDLGAATGCPARTRGRGLRAASRAGEAC